MSILRIKDENGVWHDVYTLKGEKGDKGEDGADGTVAFDDLTDEQKASLKGEKGEPGGSIDEEALDEILAIQKELIENGEVDIGGNLPEAVNDGDVLTVEGGEWKSKPPSDGGGGQAEFATVTDYEGGGKNLTTEGSLGLNANNVVVNGASFSKDGNFTKIAGVSVPEDADPYFAVNKKYVDEAVANAGDGGGQEEFAEVTKSDWGTNLQVEKRLHVNAEAIMVNGATFVPSADGYGGVINSVVVPDNATPFTVVNKQYVDDAIGSSAGGGSLNGDVVIEEGVATADVGGNFTYRKWYNGLLEVEGNFMYQNTSCNQMESLYALGGTTVDIVIPGTTGQISFIGTPSFCAVSVDGMGTFATCSQRDRNYGYGVVNITYYSIIPDNTFGAYTNLYIRGRWR